MRMNFLAVFMLALVGCGGGGGDGSTTNPSDPDNNNQVLKAIDDAYQLDKGENVLLRILDNDQISNIDSVTLEIPQDQQLEIENNGVRYIAPTSDNFTKSFTYSITDNKGNSSQATVRITAKNNTIGATLDPDYDLGVTSANQQIIIDVLANDVSSVNDTLHVTEIVNVTRGANIEIKNNQIVYTPELNFTGVDSFGYKVEDESGNSYSGVNVYVLVEAKVEGRYTELKLSDLKSFPIEKTGITLTQEYNRGAVTTAPAGDFNGDGLDDFVVCYERQTVIYNNNSLPEAGTCQVIFGTTDTEEVEKDLTLPTTNKQQIIADTAGARLGYRVSSAGDINNDGFDDVLLFAKKGTTSSAYVVLGSTKNNDNLVVNIATTNNDNVLSFSSADALINAASVGDVNNDTIDDLAFIFQSDNNSNPERRLTVVYGKNNLTGSNIDNLQMPTDGFIVLDRQASGPFDFNTMLLGAQIVSLGDINQDNHDDIGLKVVYEINSGIYKKTGAYIFFGQSPSNSNPLSLNTHVGAFISGDEGLQVESLSLGNAADFNGDGISELLIHYDETVHIYSTLNITNGVYPLSNDERILSQITNVKNWNNLLSMTSLGDVNADGFADVGLHTSAAFAQTNEFILIYGKATMQDSTTIDSLRLANDGIGDIGTVIHDKDNTPGTVMGFFSSPIGDFNGDGKNDFIIGGYGDSDYETNGEVSILFGGDHFGG